MVNFSPGADSRTSFLETWTVCHRLKIRQLHIATRYMTANRTFILVQYSNDVQYQRHSTIRKSLTITFFSCNINSSYINKTTPNFRFRFSSQFSLSLVRLQNVTFHELVNDSVSVRAKHWCNLQPKCPPPPAMSVTPRSPLSTVHSGDVTVHSDRSSGPRPGVATETH